MLNPGGIIEDQEDQANSSPEWRLTGRLASLWRYGSDFEMHQFAHYCHLARFLLFDTLVWGDALVE